MSNPRNKMERLFKIAKIILVLYPFLTLMYLSVGTFGNGQELMTVVKSNPAMTIAFLSAMVQPFVACILGAIYKEYQNGKIDTAVLNLLLLLVAEAMMRNILGMVGLGVLFYQTFKGSDFSLKRCLTQNTPAVTLKALSGSLAILPISALCLFAILQIG